MSLLPKTLNNWWDMMFSGKWLYFSSFSTHRLSPIKLHLLAFQYLKFACFHPVPSPLSSCPLAISSLFWYVVLPKSKITPPIHHTTSSPQLLSTIILYFLLSDINLVYFLDVFQCLIKICLFTFAFYVDLIPCVSFLDCMGIIITSFPTPRVMQF